MRSAHTSSEPPARLSPGMIALLGGNQLLLAGPAGSLQIPAQDKVTLKLAMLYEGQCAGIGAARAAAKFGYTRQGYYKVLNQFRDLGASAFFQRTGPKSNYRRGEAYGFMAGEQVRTEPGAHLGAAALAAWTSERKANRRKLKTASEK